MRLQRGETGMAELRIIPVALSEEVSPGDRLPEKILAALRRQRLQLRQGDILVVTHKIVSKAERRVVALAGVRPSARARRWARKYKRDARVAELALRESRRIVRRARGVLIAETRQGFVCANSGVDVSNVDGGRSAVLLPRDPDRSAAALHRALKRKLRLHVPVIITDSFGRPWREGLTEVAIGLAGLKPLHDFRGRRDLYGYRLRVTVDAVADEIAAAAGLVASKLSRTPVCVVRGFHYQRGRGRARQLVRPARRELFR